MCTLCEIRKARPDLDSEIENIKASVDLAMEDTPSENPVAILWLCDTVWAERQAAQAVGMAGVRTAAEAVENMRAIDYAIWDMIFRAGMVWGAAGRKAPTTLSQEEYMKFHQISVANQGEHI